MHEIVVEVATCEIPAWIMFFLITGSRLTFAFVAPPLFLATSQILYWINKLDSMTSLTNSTRERRRSKKKTEAYKETYMILSCVMLSNWFCRMHLKFDFYLLMDSVAMQKAFNSSSHVFKIAYEVWLPPPKKPPDGFITCVIICSIIQGVYVFLFFQGLWKIYKIVRDANNETPKEKSAVKQRTMGCYSTWELPKIVVEAFSGEMKTKRTGLTTHFDSDSSTVIVDNAANCCICNDKDMFISEITKMDPTKNLTVSTAGGEKAPIGYGDVLWKWSDDEGKVHEHTLKDVLFFPESPVNILGVTQWAIQNDDKEGTYITTKAEYSILVWNFGKNHRRFTHPASMLPEMPINEGSSFCETFYSAFMSILPTKSTSRFCLASEMDVVLNGKDKDYLGACSATDHPFQIGNNVQYIGSGTPENVVIVESIYDEAMQPNFKVERGDGSIIIVKQSEIVQHGVSDIGIVPRTQEQLRQDVDRGNTNIEAFLCPEVLTPIEENYMHWHNRLYHLPQKYMKRMSESGFLPAEFAKMKKIPKCPGCEFGKGHKRPWRVKGSPGGSIKKEFETNPGDAVSTDQIVSAQEGLIPQVTGTLTSARITGATVFVDHASSYMYVHLMRSLSTECTLEAKAACERIFATYGHKVRRYRADNGRFADKDFLESVKTCNQSISFCGVGAHHQNAIAERGIKELTLISRTILLHAQRHWPEMISTMLWPLALKAACERLNNLSINENGESPHSRMSRADNIIMKQDYHTWGCPVYILDEKLQSGSIGPPKWEPRSRLGIYVGHSPVHAGSVALVLNVITGHISPQYHVVFDDDFSTVPALRDGTSPAHWKELARDNSEKVTDASYDLAKIWIENSEDETTNDAINTTERGSTDQHQARDESITSSNIIEQGSENKSSKDITKRGSMPKMVNLKESGLRRSARGTKSIERYGTFFARMCLVTSAFMLTYQTSHPSTFISRVMNQYEKVNANFDGTSNGSHPFAFAAATADNESYTFGEMMKEADRADFINAMIDEVRSHEDNGHWELATRSSIPRGIKPILAIWSFKRKRFPDGTLNKHKARLCAHGGMQQWGVNYWETYSPVVNWISVRLLLSIAIMNDLPTTAIDFVLAFPQATLGPDELIYMEMPAGMDSPGTDRKQYVLKLRKNLYGLKQAGLNWFEYLKAGLTERGFVQSEVDPCVFYRSDAILLVYVDDCIILSKESKVVDSIVQSLATGQDPNDPMKKFSKQYVLTNDGGIKNYLGVEVDSREDGKIELRQKRLIERIIESVGLEKDILAAAKPTPVVKPLLNKDLEGLPRKYDWNYRSIVGMLGYLQGSTRPDISMATHQCARYNNDPKLSHERAIRRIGKYLLGTQNKGIIFSPNPEKGLECFVDADFSGNWTAVDSVDPENVLSRTGYIIFYAGCPIHWVSKLQTEIALSTTESEYVALSQSMRDVIPMMNILEEFKQVLFIPDIPPIVKCKVFEDNTSCIKVATAPSMTPRTKHIALKYHHFRSFVKSGQIEIFSIGTTEQTADIFTKPLSGDLFLYLRKKMMGW